MSQEAVFTFIGELDHFLPANRRGVSFAVEFKGSPSIKHMIEALGVPHTEAGLMCVNGAAVTFSYHLQPGDRVEVYPAQPASDRAVLPENAGGDPVPGEIAPSQDGELHFILDQHLGRLAVYLRMLGFDTLYRNDYDDDTLAEVASREERILLTRDRRLLMRSKVRLGCCLHSLDSRRQLAEVARRYALPDKIQPFKRCLRCNGLLQPVAKDAIIDRLEPLTRLYFDEFALCPDCHQVYWKGSHYEHMQQLVTEIIQLRRNEG
jgi:uncharacterized protein